MSSSCLGMAQVRPEPPHRRISAPLRRWPSLLRAGAGLSTLECIVPIPRENTNTGGRSYSVRIGIGIVGRRKVETLSPMAEPTAANCTDLAMGLIGRTKRQVILEQ